MPAPAPSSSRETHTRKAPAKTVARTLAGRTPTSRAVFLSYSTKGGVDEFVGKVAKATPFELVETERHGVSSEFLKALSRKLDVPQMRVFEMVGVPKATIAKKIASKEVVSGNRGQAAIGVAKLLAKAQEIVRNSTSDEAQGFDSAKWLGKWLDIPQAALGGRKPAELLDTPTGIAMVLKLLGAIESGAYQ